MYPEFGSYHILKRCTKAKGAKQNKIPTKAIFCYLACTSCLRVSFTSVCEYGSSEIKFYHQVNMVSDANATIDAVSHLKKAIKHNISCNGKYYACFIEYEKAFDFVNRDLLHTKLIKMGLHGNMLHTIQSVLKCNFQKILDGGFFSNEIEQKSGVEQGDKLSPLLFSLSIADLYFEMKCKALDVIFYADDLVLGSHCQCQLQQNLNNLSTYCSGNCLKINVNKTKCIKIRRGGRLAVDEKFDISKKRN